MRGPAKKWPRKIHDQKENLLLKGPRKEINKAELLGQTHVANKSTGKKYIKKAELLGSAHVENRIGPG